MKLSGNTQKSAISKYVLAATLMMHLGFAYTAASQNEINVMDDPHPNIGNLINNNININVMPRNPNIGGHPPTGPNGSGGIKTPVIIPVPINNPSPALVAANPQAIQTAKPVINTPKKTTPVVRTPKPQPKPTSRVAAYKPKPMVPKNTAQVIATKKTAPVRKPVKPVLATITRPKPVTPKKTTKKQKPVVVQAPVAIQKPPIIEAPMIQQNEEYASVSSPQVIIASPTNIQIPNAPLLVKTAVLPAVMINERSTGKIESSGVSKRVSYKSKHKSMKQLRYATNKKINKLFAKTRKNKIDPARCFVWK